MFTWNEPINAKSIVISSPSGPQKEEIGSDLIQLNTLSEVVRQIFNYINEHFSWPRGQNELEKIETCCHLLFLTIQKGITQRNKKTSDLVKSSDYPSTKIDVSVTAITLQGLELREILSEIKTSPRKFGAQYGQLISNYGMAFGIPGSAHNYFMRHPRLKQLYQVLCEKRPETVYEMSEFNLYCKHMNPFVRHLLKYRFYELVVKPNQKTSTRKKRCFDFNNG